MEARNRASAVARSGDAGLAAGSQRRKRSRKQSRPRWQRPQPKPSVVSFGHPLHVKAIGSRQRIGKPKLIQPLSRIPVWQEPLAKRGRLRDDIRTIPGCRLPTHLGRSPQLSRMTVSGQRAGIRRFAGALSGPPTHVAALARRATRASLSSISRVIEEPARNNG